MNDNKAAVKWSHNMTTKGLRHIQMRENTVREQVQLGFITVEHIGGKHNLADAFTKEEKNDTHFITCRNLLVTKTPTFLKQSKNTFPHNDNNNEVSNDDNDTANDVHTTTDTKGQEKIIIPVVHKTLT